MVGAIDVRVRQLAMRLSSLQPHPGSDPYLEPYPTEGDLAARWIHAAAQLGDVVDRRIADLCSGNGVLGVAAGLLGASEVTFHELDPPTSAIAQANALNVLGASDASPHWEIHTGPAETADLEGVQTVIMNPPWGVQRPRADRPIIEHALSSDAEVIHLMHSSDAAHLPALIEAHGRRAEILLEGAFRIPARFEHHTARSSSTPFTCWRIE